jgi:hypothetical protein
MLSRSLVDLATPVEPVASTGQSSAAFGRPAFHLKKSATSMPGVIPSGAPEENPLRAERVHLLLVSVLQNAVVEAGAAAL